MNQYLQYWKSDDFIGNKFDPIIHSASNQFKKLLPDDVLWIVTLRDRQVFLIGRLHVGEVLNRSQFESRYQDAYPKEYFAVAKEGTVERENWVNLEDEIDDIRFSSPTGRDRLIRKNGIVNGKQLQTLRLLNHDSINLLETKWYGAVAKLSDELVANIRKGAAGFGNAENNRKVEKAAVDFVTKQYERDGWKVKSVEPLKCGYDLLCTKNGKAEHVEVKGIGGGDLGFIITANEVSAARKNANFRICAVTSAITNPQLHTFTGGQFLEAFRIDALAYRAVKI
jgi:hypothetical protein